MNAKEVYQAMLDGEIVTDGICHHHFDGERFCDIDNNHKSFCFGDAKWRIVEAVKPSSVNGVETVDSRDELESKADDFMCNILLQYSEKLNDIKQRNR